MSTEIKIPSVGESITEVTVARWVKNNGDKVEMDEVLCELESDKATFELNAETSGKLKTKVAEGETVEIGTVIGEIVENSSDIKDEKSGKADSQQQVKKPEKENIRENSESTTEPERKKTGKSGKMVEMNVPAVGESINEVTLSSWLKRDGEYVELDDVIAEIESDKATFELTADASGILHHVVNEGDTLEIGALICRIEKSGPPQTAEKKKPVKKEIEEEKSEEKSGPAKTKATEESYAAGLPSPAAAKIMAEKGIKPEEVNGTGPGGRITKEDVINLQPTHGKETERREEPGEPMEIKAEAGVAEPAGRRNQRKKKISQLRKTIAKRLVDTKNQTAMLTTFNEVNMEPIMVLRKKYKDKFKEKYDVNLGFMSFFAKACCIALKEWPAVNSMIDGDEFIFNDFVDISIAVSAPKGLVVPVIRNAESMTFAELEKEVIRLATKARENKLSIEEMTGGTFTITNGGVFGSLMSTPIINAPQSAILGMHNIQDRPVAENGEIKIKPMMYLALSYDHRAIDGRESVSFLVRLKELLEDPARLLLEI